MMVPLRVKLVKTKFNPEIHPAISVPAVPVTNRWSSGGGTVKSGTIQYAEGRKELPYNPLRTYVDDVNLKLVGRQGAGSGSISSGPLTSPAFVVLLAETAGVDLSIPYYCDGRPLCQWIDGGEPVMDKGLSESTTVSTANDA
ncbi:hypothetical protein F5888DRAFT_1634824 [Russula emetica]|nr:hypothetical protein F5888DRAFT_1634824 [Russula emetica]